MAAICVARPVSDDNENASCRLRILKSTTGWAEKVQFAPAEQVRMSTIYYAAHSSRYLLPQALHTANSSPEPRPSPTTRNTAIHTDSYTKASVLVAELLESLACSPSLYGTTSNSRSVDEQLPSHQNDLPLARAYTNFDTTAPTCCHNKTTASKRTSPTSTMDFSIDFGDTSGFKTKPNKKKKAATTRFDAWGADGDDKKDDTGTNGAGGGDGAGYGGGGGGDASGAGGGGDDNNGGGNDDEDWGFSAVKKAKKKTKKQQQEEEEEEKRRQEEDAKATNNDPLSWADDANDTNANDDWGMWGTSKKDKKKKKDDALPAVPDAPPAASTFQDINLDDGAPKLDFSFDGLNDSKKNDNAGGFGAWGKTWDFGSIAKEEKKEETSEFGNNNPWGVGTKNKKKTTMSTGFDFGDFTSDGGNDLTFDTNNNDIADTKSTDDAWGFATQGKKDKKKKGAIEEIKEEPVIESESKTDEMWGGWGAAKTSKTKKKSTFDEAFTDKAADDSNKNGDMSFDWGFGGSKTKKKDLVAEVIDEPVEKAADGDDWMSGAWGAASKKKKDKKKSTTEDLSASVDLASIADAKTVTSDPPADDIWSTFTSGTSKKKTKKGFFDDEPPPPPEAPEPPPANNDSIWGTFGTKSTKKSKGFDLISEAEETTALQEAKEPLVAWDFGLTPKDRKKKEKQMKLDYTWDSRVTQEMVDAEAEKAVEPAIEVVVDESAEPEPEPISVLDAPDMNLSLANETPWDFGLSPVKKRKREKEMRLDGTWDTRITQEMIDDAKAAIVAEAAAAPTEEEALKEIEVEQPAKSLADEVPWDHGLDAVTRRKRQKEMKADGTWETRITQAMIDDAKAAEEEAKKPKPYEDELEFEPVQDPEPEAISDPIEVRVPWDHGLNPKEKRKREKEMRADGIWEDRLTQEMIDEEATAATAATEAKDFFEHELGLDSERKASIVEERYPWDHGLSAKEKKRVEKQMRLDGTWDTRLTQEMIDEEAQATIVDMDVDINPVLEPEESAYIDPSEKKPWDHGLSIKEKKKLEKEMKLDGTWESRLTQEQIDEEIAAAAAAVVMTTEPEPEIVAVVEERVPWDHNLSPKEKRKKEKEMKLAGTWEDRLTQEQIDEQAAAASIQIVPELNEDVAIDVAETTEPRLPWDHGLGTKEKKKKEKEMRLNGTWADRLTQEQIDEEEATKAATANAEEPDPEPVQDPEPEGQANDSWSFGWGGSKTKPKKKSLLDLEPEKVEEKQDEGWGGSWGFGLKKKKDKTPAEEIPPPEPEPEPESKVDDVWSFGTTTKDKKKKDKSARKSELFEPVVEEVEPPPPPPANDDIWATFGTKTDKKTSKKSKAKEEAPPPPPSPPPVDVLHEADADTAIPSVDDFDWGGLGTGRKSNKSLTQETSAKKSSKSLVEETPARKSNKSLVEETPARKSNKSLVEETSAKKSSKSLIDEEPAKKSSVWGFGSTTSATKTRKEKEAQAKKEAEEQAQREEEERIQREAEEAEIERLVAEEAAKATKKSKAGKASKSSKDDGKKKNGDLLDLLDDPVPTPATSSSKLKKSSTRGSDKAIADLPEEEVIPEIEPEKDYFGFWGGSSSNAKKTAGKKSTGSKKEITTSVLTNEEDALLAELDENEIQAILDDAPVPSSSKITKTMSNEKTKPSSSVADRIKAFGGGKEDAGKKSKQAEARLTNVEPEIEETLSPKEAKKAAKGKSSTLTSAKSSKSKVKEDFSLPEIEPKKSKDSVPGSFPGAFADEEEDLLGIDEALPEPDLDLDIEPVLEKPKKKSDKTGKKVNKASNKSSKKSIEATMMEEPADFTSRRRSMADEPDLLDDEITLPTPPPEADKKSTKKERPRVERSATSWGFWGTATQPPKKLSRSKTLDDVSPPSSRKTKSPPAVTRSKSIRNAKADDNDAQKESEKASKSSASDKESATKSVDRSKPSRGMSGLTNFMLGGAPPSAMRQSQNVMARRQSTSSHPLSRSSSRRHSVDQSGMASPPPENESPVTKKAAKLMGYASGTTQRRSSVKGKTSSYADPYPIDDDDMVMIRDNSKDDELKSRSKPKNKIVTSVGKGLTKPRSKTLSGDEDVVMVDSPLAIDSANEDFVKPVLQRSNTGRKSAGLFGSLFGVSSKTPVERSRSSPVTDNEDNALPIRSRTSSRKRTGEGLVADIPGETDGENVRQSERRARRSAREQAEDDERQAREQRRRDRREREKADLEARREKAREQARREREAEEQQKQERRARRREREAAERARIEREEAEAEVAAERRREERRRREKVEAEAPIYPISKEDRRRTYAGEDERRRSRKDERSKSRPTDGPGRRSSVLMAEYHESRSGSGRGVKPPANKTSSWIDSQQEEPPDMPPVEGTVLDESGQTPRPVDDAESNSRRRRKDKYAGMTEEEIARHRAKRRERRLVEKSTSSDEKVKKREKRRSTYEDDFYANPIRTFDGRPALGRSESKRNSLFGRFF